MPYDLPTTCDDVLSYYSGCDNTTPQKQGASYFRRGDYPSHSGLKVNYTLTLGEFERYHLALYEKAGTVYNGTHVMHDSCYNLFSYEYDNTVTVSPLLWKEPMVLFTTMQDMLIATDSNSHLETYLILKYLYGPVEATSNMRSSGLAYTTASAYKAFCSYDNTTNKEWIFNLC
jgi:hypothetical protein